MISLIHLMLSLIRQDLFFYYLRGYAFDITAQQTQVCVEILHQPYVKNIINYATCIHCKIFWTLFRLIITILIPSYHVIFSNILLYSATALDAWRATSAPIERIFLYSQCCSLRHSCGDNSKLIFIQYFFTSSSVKLMPKTKSFELFLLCLHTIFLSNCNGCYIA